MPTTIQTSTPEEIARDQRVRALVNPPYGAAKEIVALGREGLARVLDAQEGKVSFFASTSDDFHDDLDYRQGLALAVGAFAAKDLAAVLAAFEARGWSAVAIARSGVAAVADPRVVPFLLAVYGEKGALSVSAVNDLAAQRDPRATDLLVRALSDRSPLVREAAVEALGDIGDSRAAPALTALAAKTRSAKLADHARAALEKLRP